VIGAGASGSVATLTALNYGLNVITLEANKKVGVHTGSKIDIIENIGIDHIIKELNLPVTGRSNISRWHSPNYNFELKSEINDFFIKRGPDDDSFDIKNMHKAKDKGAQILTNTHPIKFEWDKDNNVKQVIAKNNGKKIEIKPDFIIGADGVNSNVSQLSGLSKTEQLVGEFQAYGVLGIDFNLPTEITHVFFDRTIAPGGYVFTVKNGDKNCVLGIGLDPLLTNKTPKEHYQKLKLHQTISKILNNAKIRSNFCGYGKFGLLKNRAIGNIMLVGDAGRLLDPLFGFGLKQAILSGHAAANVCKSVKESTAQKQPCKEYESSISPLINEIKLNLFLRKSYRKINNQDIDAIVKILADIQEEGLTLDYLFKRNNRILLKHIFKNGKRSTLMFLKAFPNIAEYFLKIHLL